jgi:hypothetical protein
MSISIMNDAPVMGGTKGRWSWSMACVVAAVVLFLGYVFSAPLVHDGRGFPLPIHKPVWSAARQGPASWILRPYFKLCGIQFPAEQPMPPTPNYE